MNKSLNQIKDIVRQGYYSSHYLGLIESTLMEEYNQKLCSDIFEDEKTNPNVVLNLITSDCERYESLLSEVNEMKSNYILSKE